MDYLAHAEGDLDFLAGTAEKCLCKLVAFLLVQDVVGNLGVCFRDAAEGCAVDCLGETGVLEQCEARGSEWVVGSEEGGELGEGGCEFFWCGTWEAGEWCLGGQYTAELVAHIVLPGSESFHDWSKTALLEKFTVLLSEWHHDSQLTCS